jgi:hypothetical protein
MQMNSNTGGAWLSSARVVKYLVKSKNERNPCLQLLPLRSVVEDSEETAGVSWRKVRMTSSQHAPYALGDTRATMVGTIRSNPARVSKSDKPYLSSDCRLQPACMKPELLVIAGQPHGGEYVPGPCTHRPSQAES